MKAEGECVPDLLLEQYALGELSIAERARVDALLTADPGLRGRLGELRRSNEEILAEYEPAEIAAAVRRRMLVGGASPGERAAAGSAIGGGALRGAKKPRRFRLGSGFAFPAAAAVLVLVGAVMARGLLSPSQGDVIVSKSGAPGLFVYEKAASGPALLADGASAAAGDILQIKYAAGSARYGAIASLDGRGGVTWHLPAGYDGSAISPVLAPSINEKGGALGSAYELDDAPSFERFFIVSSRDDFDLSIVSSALRGLALSGAPDTGALRLPAGLECKTLLLRKTGGAR
jgi:hypothetical protein